MLFPQCNLALPVTAGFFDIISAYPLCTNTLVLQYRHRAQRHIAEFIRKIFWFAERTDDAFGDD